MRARVFAQADWLATVGRLDVPTWACDVGADTDTDAELSLAPADDRTIVIRESRGLAR